MNGMWRTLAKAACVVACFTGFSLQSYEIFLVFLNGEVSIGLEYNKENKMALPSLTVCPAKTTKFPMDKRTATRGEFMASTYSFDDLFLPTWADESSWKFKAEVIGKGFFYCFLSTTLTKKNLKF